MESQLDAILSNESGRARGVFVSGGSGDRVEDYYNKYDDGDDAARSVSCDCESCLRRELLRVKREILCMIEQQQAAARPEEALPSSVSASVADSGGGGGSAARWRFLYVGKGSAVPPVDAARAVEDEFEADCDLAQFAMVSGGAFVDVSGSSSERGEKGPSTVEGQLSALLTSGGKDGASAWKRAEKEEEGGRRKHANLIENQLLSLEEQFWRSRGGVKEPHPASEATALLADTAHETTMSDSTPVKRPTIKVSLAGTTGVPVSMLDRGSGGEAALDGGQKTANAASVAATATANFGRMKRFEQFLKSLMGKKTTVVGAATSATAPVGGAFEQPALKVRSSVELKSHAGLRSSTQSAEELEVPVVLRHSFGSMSSLNSAVQQKFLNILPAAATSTLSAAKRNLSVNNLSTIPESAAAGSRRAAAAQCGRLANGRTGRGMKTVSCSNFESLHQQEVARGPLRTANPQRGVFGDNAACCAVVVRDSCVARRMQMSKSANHLQSMVGGTGAPVRALNRFRNSLLEPSVSQLNIAEECSRCSSILSLAAGTTGKVRCSDSSAGSSVELVDGRPAQPVAEEPPRPGVVVVTARPTTDAGVGQSCKLCLGEVSPQQMTGISQCRCTFCTDVSARRTR